MKDELPHLGLIDSFEQLLFVIDDYMDYYNNERYQWGLAKLSPNQYADFVKTGDYPLKNLVKIPICRQKGWEGSCKLAQDGHRIVSKFELTKPERIIFRCGLGSV